MSKLTEAEVLTMLIADLQRQVTILKWIVASLVIPHVIEFINIMVRI